jgi:hypothetical protein
MELESEIGGRIFSEPAEVISHTHLHEVQNPDKVTTDMATRYSSRTDKTYPSVFNSDPQHEGNPFSSTPATANEPTQPDVIWPEPWGTLPPEYAWGAQVPSNTNVPNQQVQRNLGEFGQTHHTYGRLEFPPIYGEINREQLTTQDIGKIQHQFIRNLLHSL